MGDASVGRDRTAGMDAALAVPNRERGALRGCRIPFGVPHCQRLPMDLIGRQTGDEVTLAEQECTAKSVATSPIRRATLHRSRWRDWSGSR